MGGQLYAIGRVVKAFGIRGEVVVEPLTSIPARFKTLQTVLIGRTSGSTKEFSILVVTPGTKGVRLHLTGIESRNDAEGLVGSFLFVSERDRVPLPKGSHYVDDLIGLNVVDEKGARVGTVTEVMKLPAQDVYVVKHEGSEIMIPAVKQFILRIDVRERIMVVKMIDGMRKG